MSDPYKLIHRPGHSKANKNGWVREHIFRAQKALGRDIPKGVEVHHFSIEQLVICENRSYHVLLHKRTQALKECGHANWMKCCFCKQYDHSEKLIIHQNYKKYYHRSCCREAAKAFRTQTEGRRTA